MKYYDSTAKSAEYLGPVLSLMARQSAAMDPVSFSVWYEYVAGRNPSLKSSIDGHLNLGDIFDEKLTGDLFNKHIADIDIQASQRFGEGLQKVMAEMASSAALAGDQAGQFGTALEQWCSDWKSTNPGANAGVAAILGLTRTMQGSIGSLKKRLDESRSEIEELQKEVGVAREDAQADGLTGLTNRRGFDVKLANCFATIDPGLCGPSLIMADIDHFKEVNDSYGHPFGDRVIQAVAQILKNNAKGTDIAARYGGEEFVVLLPNTPSEGARQIAESIRAMVGKCRIKRSADTWSPANLSLSLGVASFQAGESAADLVARADVALYASKHEGRNRVTVAEAKI